MSLYERKHEMSDIHYINLSKQITERIEEDRQAHLINPFACRDEDVIRRDMSHDIANLQRPAFVRDTEKIMNVPFSVLGRRWRTRSG